MSSSDEEEQIEIDADTCNSNEISNLFTSLSLSSEEAISLKKNYILHLDTSSDFNTLAAATSNKSIHIFDLNNSKGFTQLSHKTVDTINTANTDAICGIRFANTNSNTVFVSSTDGKIGLYDLRAPTIAAVQTFECDTVQKKPFTCFDLNANDTVLCAGTEQSSSEAYLLFFDVRKQSTLGAYTDSHRDDLTQVKFHNEKHNILASGSTDGLINVFDIVQSTEDDALEHCLNTESSIQTLGWHPKANGENLLTCITDTNDFQLFDVEDSELVFQCDRSEITKLMKRKLAADCYLVNCHTDMNGNVFLLAGSNFNRGECLRSLTVHNNAFKERANFVDNKQIVRCSLYNEKTDVLITAGEGGIISVWENRLPNASVMGGQKLKEKVKHKDRKSKPY